MKTKLQIISLLLVIFSLQLKAQTPLSTAVDFTATDIHGQEINLFEILDGGQFVLIDFFFTNCGPCQDVTPNVKEAYERLGCNEHDIFFMEVSHIDGNSACNNWANFFGIEYPTISQDGGGAEIVSAYQVVNFPTLIIIAPDRSIVKTQLYPSSSDVVVNELAPFGIEEHECGSGPNPNECEPASNLQGVTNGSKVQLSWEAPNLPKHREILFTDDFESGVLDKWTLVDNDGDGENWLIGDFGHIGEAHSGKYFASSWSWNEITYYPDNWMISPDISGANRLHYFLAGNVAWRDHYSIMASTTGTELSDFVVIFDETIPAYKGEEDSENVRSTKTEGGDRAMTPWLPRTIKLPEGTKYIAFRHHDSADKNYLFIDDVVIEELYIPYTYTLSKGNVAIATELMEPSYTDYNVADGTYNYCVKVVYPDCTSDPVCASVTVDISNYCPQATNVKATIEDSDVVVTWDAPNSKERDVLFSDGFESANLNNWMLIDNDGDGKNWFAGAFFHIAEPHGGSYVASSWGWDGFAVNPDNYMVSPIVTGATTLNYFLTGNPSFKDHYAICASSTGTAVSDFTIVFEEDIPEDSAVKEGVRSASTEGGNGNKAVWHERKIALPDGTKFVAFRHFDSYNMNYVFIDDVSIIGISPYNDYTYTITKNGEEIATGLTENTYRDINVGPGFNDYCVKVVYESCTSNPTCTNIVGIEDEVADNSVKIFPNPARDVINISGDVANVVMYNSLGQVVRTGVNKGQIDVTSLQNGIYYITLIGSDRSRKVEKVIIAK